jgi:hypothetical protein
VHRADTWDVFTKLKYWLGNLFDPNNPFIPYVLISTLLIILVHLVLVYWVYRDALWRYNRGAPWALVCMVLPFAGWGFYLLYRRSPLVEFDRIDAEYFDEDFTWTDYDTYKKDQGARFFKDLTSFFRGEDGSGYSPWVRRSRERELKRKRTPEEIAAAKRERREKREQWQAERKQRAEERRALKQERRQESRERQTVQGAHGSAFKLSDRRQRKIRQRLQLIEKLKELPREDPAIEQLIYDMNYAGALAAAREGLEIAREMNDRQGLATYEAYVERLERLAAEEGPEQLDGQGS